MITPYADALELADSKTRLVVAPRFGAAVLRYDWIANGNATPIFRPTPEVCRPTSDFAMIAMLPWVNRIAGGGFTTNGTFHALEPNIPGQPFPIHGNGFQSRWTIVRRTATSLDLELDSVGPGRYRYHADYALRLDGGALTAEVAITNRADITLPFGLGFHPWIVRQPDMTLEAAAIRYWTEDERHLPKEAVSVTTRPDIDFRTPRSLPEGWINSSFEGWNGFASLRSSSARTSLKIEASAPLSLYHLYSPGRDAGFVCFEPVSHIPDGFNRRDEVVPPPSDDLGPGMIMRAMCQFSPTTSE